ncbi:MAG: DNA primase DnaG [Methanosarcinales archaeon Met12]|nr:MAG: DNA primase DnaG [Methanosarcinales archaeon Met12]
MQNSDTTKYIIYANINADGIVEKPDVVGAIFGQTEGLLGDDMDLRDLQKSGRVGRIEVNINAKSGKSSGSIMIPSSLGKVETSIMAASLETIERIGPCTANITVSKIEDIRAVKRKQVIDRAKYILTDKFDDNVPESQEIAESVKHAMRIEGITSYGDDALPAGPNVTDSDAILIVEGRADVLNLLRYGIKNTIAVEGTNVSLTIGDLSKNKTVTVFLDGDRGGDLLLKELLQIADINYVARAPEGKSVEDLTQKEVIKALRNKVPAEQAMEVSTGHRVQKKEGVVKRRILNLSSIRRRVEKPKQEDTPPVSATNEKALKTYAEELSGTLSAKLLNADKKAIGDVAVRDLANVLREANSDVKGVIFDGVITQRIIDIAAEKKLDYLVGVKLGNIANRPPSLKVLTSEELK